VPPPAPVVPVIVRPSRRPPIELQRYECACGKLLLYAVLGRNSIVESFCHRCQKTVIITDKTC
jgi:hypothetical protein